MAAKKEKAGGCGLLIFLLFLVIWGVGSCVEKVGDIMADIGIIDRKINTYSVGTKKLNMRKLANPNSDVVKELLENDSVWSIENKSKTYQNDTWVYVTDKIDTGWVNETYLN